EGNTMSTRASQNGTTEAEMEFEAAHYSNPEMEDEWEVHEGHPYTNPFSNPEMEEEWEVPEGSPYTNPFTNPELEEEWEVPEGSPYTNPFTNPELEEEWEVLEGSPYSHPYSQPYFNPEREPEIGSWLANAARALLPQAKSMAMKVGSDLLRRMGQR